MLKKALKNKRKKMELGQLMDCCPMVYLGEGHKAMHTAGEKDCIVS